MKQTPPKKLLLCVDDDEDDYTWIEEGARKAIPDIRFEHKTNGQEAMHFLEQIANEAELPCLILMDINMPYLNGRDTALRLKQDKRYQAIPVIIFTTSANKMDVLFFRTKGIEMISKPSNYTEFVQTIESIVHKHCSN